MKSFTKTINGIKYKGEIFEELDIRNKFNLSNEEWELINKYQNTFKELLLKDTKDFVIDGRILWEQLGSPQGKFATWIERKLLKSEILTENKDYISILKNAKRDIGGSISKEYMLTLDCAKNLCMMEKKNGQMVRSYFILMEKILKDYEKWSLIREPEKCGANDMRQAIKEWCNRNDKDCSITKFYTREFNMINECLTGFVAVDIRSLKHIQDNKTRDNLDSEVNNAIHMLQFTNIALLNSNLDFDTRTNIIKNTCESTYKHIKEEFNK